MNKIKDLDLYLLLEVPPEAAEKDIRKAYRKKALKCHPDKTGGDKAGEIITQEINANYDLCIEWMNLDDV